MLINTFDFAYGAIISTVTMWFLLLYLPLTHPLPSLHDSVYLSWFTLFFSTVFIYTLLCYAVFCSALFCSVLHCTVHCSVMIWSAVERLLRLRAVLVALQGSALPGAGCICPLRVPQRRYLFFLALSRMLLFFFVFFYIVNRGIYLIGIVVYFVVYSYVLINR